jgi:sn-glycerol 3-phosphate transport system ATP-binding protein/multiple sugar transport system ATP-binding protein
MVFQSYALYPHLTVRDNLAFGLKLRGTPAAQISERIGEVSRMLGLGELLDRYPRQMSGGQRQRVAMGRAIARRPTLFLFDEPLSNLDAALRAEVRVEIKRLHATLGATMIYVTHDQVEAMTLADRLVVLAEGAIEQIGPPLDVYRTPASRFVASFMGSPSMNFVAAKLEGGRVRAEGVDVPAPREMEDRDVLVGIRPHDVVAVSDEGAGEIALTVDVVEAMGFEAYAHGRVGGAPFVARIEPDLAESAKPGDLVHLTVPPAAVHLFDPKTERSL